jgi:hypothetical protein
LGIPRKIPESLLIKGLDTRWIDPAALGYVRAALFDLPLVLIGSWVIMRSGSAKRS